MQSNAAAAPLPRLLLYAVHQAGSLEYETTPYSADQSSVSPFESTAGLLRINSTNYTFESLQCKVYIDFTGIFFTSGDRLLIS